MSKLGLGREHLNADEKFAYDLIEAALLRKASSCDVSRVRRSVNVLNVLMTVLGDNPGIVYYNKTRIYAVSGFLGKQLTFSGCMGRSQAKKYEDALQKALEDAVWEIDKKAGDDKEILQGISEYLQRNVVYDDEELKAVSWGVSKHPMSHTAYGALVNHKAVCDGFSDAYALIAQYFGFRCMVVDGKSSYRRNARVPHAWNIVEYEGEYFHIDATWDTNTYEAMKVYSYDYFGLDDDEVSLDHEWNFRKTPKCNSSKLSYFRANNLYANSETQIEDLLCKMMKRKEKTIQIKISPGIGLPADEKKFLEDKITSAAMKSNAYSGFSYVWQDTSRCLLVIMGD